MKNSTTRTTLGLLISFIFLAFSSTLNSNRSIALNEEPNLPETPYDYSISIPDYLTNSTLWSKNNGKVLDSIISDDKATLGRVLFYDKRISKDYSLSCASCHQQQFGFADHTIFSAGIFGQQTKRNVPNLNDLAWKSNSGPANTPLFWDAREDDLKEMVLQPILHPEELGMDMDEVYERLNGELFYHELFEKAYGSPVVTSERISDALKQFILSMVTFDSKYDKVKNGEMYYTDDEANGEILFTNECGSCHTAPLFAVPEPQRNFFSFDTLDLGVGGLTGFWGDNWRFKSPSLRNIAQTAPYMHDGRISTLEDVVEFYSDSITSWSVLTSINFNEDEVDQVIAFLNTLTSTNLLTHPKWSDPFGPLSPNSEAVTDDAVRIYPNPLNAIMNLDLSGMAGQYFELTIFRQDGSLVRKLELNEKKIQLESSGLQPGIYAIKIKGKEEQFTKLVVVQ